MQLPYNSGMRHLDILIPFALPATAMGADLLRVMETPSLAVLLGRMRRSEHRLYDPFARALPHETWLARAFDLPFDPKVGSSPPLALQTMRQFGNPPERGVWFLVNPVHIHIARDHLVLTDRRNLELSDTESRALFTIAEPVFAENGKHLLYGDAGTWFLQADGWRDLTTSTPDATCGHNIDIWMPKGPQEREWRKLQNEVQMQWHASDINQAREMIGKQPINSLWLWAGTVAPLLPQPSGYNISFNLSGWMEDFGKLADRHDRSAGAADVFASHPGRGLLLLDALIQAALAGDMAEWLLRMNALERQWFAPLLQALRDGQLQSCRLILTHGTVVTEVSVDRNSLRRFWKKPTLSGLLA